MDVTNSKNLYTDNPVVEAVPVIASFDGDGRIVPLYIRYEGLRLKVDHIVWRMEDAFARETFCCEITMSDRVLQVLLHYDKKPGVWTMDRIRD